MRILLLPLLLVVFSASYAQKKKYKKSVGVTVSLPLLHNYHYYDYGEATSLSATGLFGIGGSVFYEKGKTKYSLNGGVMSTYSFRPALSGGGPSTPSVQFLEAVAHHNFYNGFNWIFGLNVSNYKYKWYGADYPGGSKPYTKNDQALGLTVGTGYTFSKTFSVALFYRPSIYSFETKSYKHNVSLDARFDIRFWGK